MRLRKCLAILLLLLLVAVPAYPWSLVGTIGSQGGGGGGGAGTGGNNLLGEGFEGAGYEAANWVETYTGSSTVNEDASHSGTLWRSDKGSQALATYYDGTNESFSTNTLASNHTKTYTEFYWYFSRNVVTGNNERVRLTRLMEVDGAGLVWELLLNHTTGDGLDKAYIRYYNHTPDLIEHLINITLTPGNWYGFRIYYYADQVSSGIDTWVDSGAGFVQSTPSDTGTRNMAARKLMLGPLAPNGTGWQSATFQYDIVKMDDTAFETGY